MKQRFRIQHGEFCPSFFGAPKHDPRVRVIVALGQDPAVPASEPPNKSRAGIKYRGQETASLYQPRTVKTPKGSRFQLALLTSDDRPYMQLHGTRYRTEPKLRKKQRIALRRAQRARP